MDSLELMKNYKKLFIVTLLIYLQSISNKLINGLINHTIDYNKY